MKSDALIHLITQKGIFGPCVAHVKTTQFQKRGFPNDHILIILKENYKLSTSSVVNKVIWESWPDPITQPHLFEIVKSYMDHVENSTRSHLACAMENVALVLKAFQDRTTLSEDGYPLYYRPNDD